MFGLHCWLILVVVSVMPGHSIVVTSIDTSARNSKFFMHVYNFSEFLFITRRSFVACMFFWDGHVH